MDIDNANLRRKPVNDRDPPSMDDLQKWVGEDQYDHVKDAFERFDLPTANLLHEARSGAMVDLLVRNGADVNQRYQDEVPEELRGPDPITGEEQEDRVDTPLQGAVQNGRKEVFDRLLAHKADFEIGGDHRPLMLALGHFPDGYLKCYGSAYPPGCDATAMVEMANTLLDKGARVLAERGEMPALFAAVEQGHQAPMVKRLLEAGGNAQQGFEDRGTPLHHVKDNQPGVVDLLLDYGAKINEKPGVVDLPLDYGAKIINETSYNETNGTEETPLEVAMHNGQIKTAERLIERGANVDELMQGPKWQRHVVDTQNDPPRKAAVDFVRGASIEREQAALRQVASEASQAHEVAEQPAPRRRVRL